MQPTEPTVREFVIAWLTERDAAIPADPAADPNLIEDGLVDSLAFLDLMTALEMKFKVDLDFGDVDPEVFTKLSGLTAIVLACAPGPGS